MRVIEPILVYFSATSNTQVIVRAVAKSITPNSVKEYNLIKEAVSEDILISSDNVLIVGVPSYSGRVPAIAREGLAKFRGDNTPVILVCTYGNRDYEDTLLELKDLMKVQGFLPVSAGAFIARHSIFPKLAADRPNLQDLASAAKLGERSMELLLQNKISERSELRVKGNHPYREVGKLPIVPTGGRDCTACGACSRQCPVQAISDVNPRKTDKERCISCAHCIAICPVHTRKFRGILYYMASRKFVSKYSDEKRDELIYTV